MIGELLFALHDRKDLHVLDLVQFMGADSCLFKKISELDHIQNLLFLLAFDLEDHDPIQLRTNEPNFVLELSDQLLACLLYTSDAADE